MSDLSWMNKANCKGRSEYFFASYSERPQARARRVEKAKKICAECAVREQCKEYGRQNTEIGVWGGETEEERYLNGFMANDPTLRRRMTKRITQSYGRTR